jgi:ADP-ribose pyrophosphatase
LSKLTEERISGVVLHAGNFFELHRDVVRLPDGSQAVRDYLRHPGAVAIVALTHLRQLGRFSERFSEGRDSFFVRL